MAMIQIQYLKNMNNETHTILDSRQRCDDHNVERMERKSSQGSLDLGRYRMRERSRNGSNNQPQIEFRGVGVQDVIDGWKGKEGRGCRT